MKFEEKKIPVIEWTFDENDMDMGVDCISFVEDPATEVNWMKFNAKKPQRFEKNKAKRMVTGPIMLADTPIYRVSESMGEYFGKFSPETIEKMMIKYFKEGKMNRVNEEHTSNRIVDDVFLVESFIVGDKIESKLFENLPAGTWVGTFYIKDEEYWNEKIMKDEFGGFSLEGMFFEELEENMMSQLYSKVEALILHANDDQELIDNLEELLK